ncbi:MAG: phosphatase PAP2 family protein [candidate division Zixibacteria bacterium]|nr:phosphatase PAP2 family protein [candidate division Zixibacteria bacterium]
MVLDFIVNIDIQVFYFINMTIANNVMDLVMPFITEESNFLYPLIAVCVGIIFLMKRRGLVILLWGGVLIALSDQLSSSVIKPLVDRPRPCHELDLYRLLVNCGAGKSFPSSHATNMFAAATFFGEKFLNRRREFYLVAFMVALSRVYVGVHYPLDVIAGAAIGIGLGIGIGTLADYLGSRYWFLSTEHEEKRK